MSNVMSWVSFLKEKRNKDLPKMWVRHLVGENFTRIYFILYVCMYMFVFE